MEHGKLEGWMIGSVRAVSQQSMQSRMEITYNIISIVKLAGFCANPLSKPSNHTVLNIELRYTSSVRI